MNNKAIDQAIINYAVYEDKNEYIGMSQATLPDLSAITQTISGAGIAGNIEAVILGNYDTMEMSLDFRTMTEQSTMLSEPRRHNIDLRAAIQDEDPVTGQLVVRKVKHVLVVVPKGETGGTIAPAQPSNGTGTYAVRYWATYFDGKLIRKIDPLNFVCYFNGVDYLEEVRKALGK